MTAKSKQNSLGSGIEGFRAGDKVKVDLEAVERNGLFESEGQQRQFDYLAAHPEEVYVIASTEADAMAKIRLDHPVVGETSFFEEELVREVADNEIF